MEGALDHALLLTTQLACELFLGDRGVDSGATINVSLLVTLRDRVGLVCDRVLNSLCGVDGQRSLNSKV